MKFLGIDLNRLWWSIASGLMEIINWLGDAFNFLVGSEPVDVQKDATGKDNINNLFVTIFNGSEGTANMTKTINRAVCVILIVLTIAISLISCDNGGNQISSSGEIGSEVTGYMHTYAWNVDARRSGDGKGKDYNTYNELKEALANGDRFSDISVRIKDTKELRGKKLEKTTFTIEADRKVTLTILWRCYDLDSIEKTYRKTTTLEPNKPQNIELNFTDEFKINRESVVGVFFLQNDNEAKAYSYGTDAFAEWSQTIYKITDFKIFCD